MSDISEIVEIARELRRVNVDGAEAFVVVPGDFKAIALERYRLAPTARRGAVAVTTPEAFAAYVNTYRTAHAAVFVDAAAGVFVGVLDYHAPGLEGAAAWGRHRVRLELAATPEWRAWADVHGRALAQETLADFLEDHIGEIAEPAGATLIEAARALTVHTSSTFVSQAPGAAHTVKVTYTADERAAGPNDVTLPTRLRLGIRPYEGTDRYRLDVRLRVTTSRDGQKPIARFTLTRIAPEAVQLEAVADVRASIAGVVKDVPIFDGSVADPAPEPRKE